MKTTKNNNKTINNNSIETIKRRFKTATIISAVAFSVFTISNQKSDILNSKLVVYAASDSDTQELADNSGIETINNINYSLDESGKFYSVVGYDRSIESYDTIELNSNINGIPVSKIADHAFANINANKFTIPSSIKSIGNNSFYCAVISEIEFSEGLESIGKEAFAGCSISEIKLPESLKLIGKKCFNSSRITKINIPGNVKTIPYQCFDSCWYLTELTIEKGVEEIKAEAFSGIGAKTLVLPSSIVRLSHKRNSIGRDKDQSFAFCSAKLTAYENSYIENYLSTYFIDHEVVPDPDYHPVDYSNNKYVKDTRKYKVKRLKVTKSKKNKTITVKFKKDSRFNYKVSLSNNKNFKKSKTKVIKGKYRTKYTFKKKSGKYNYVSVVAYRKIDFKNYYSKKVTKRIKL